MPNRNQNKGKVAEREVAALLQDMLGLPVRRKLGAGRLDDVGDLDGVPDTVIQVANWADALRAVREKPLEAEQQRENAGASFVSSFVRLRGGTWRVVMTPQQWATLMLQVLA
ncbi:MAG: hypothetical protein ACTHMS_12345 [Jatrophihabitans sp.]|uniref:hypothetical protein n=1 Tax=Jatrophihabitans sp. TaxID=1932789 RepID=UPI003F80258F